MEPCGQPQIGRLPSPPGAIPHPHIAEKTAECYIERWNFTSRKRGQRMKGRGKSRISRSRFLRRFLGHESLESLNLLATMAGDSPWQNPLDPSDLNCDGDVSPSDALVAINAINSGMSGQLDLKSAPPMLAGIVKGAVSDFMDVDGDGQLSPADALTVINDLNVGRHNGGGFGNLPTDDQQGNDIAHATPLTLSDRGFAKVKALINSDGDVDVFQVTPTKTQLSVGLFSAASGVMTVSVVDAAGTELDSVSTEAGKHHPVNLNVTVDTTKSYFLVVSGAAGVTGPYGLTVLNFTDLDFKPETDSELGDDLSLIHI